MNRRAFLQGALRLTATVVGAAALIMPLKPEAAAELTPGAPALTAGTAAWVTSYRHKTWALGIELSQEAMEDDLYGFSADMAKQLGRASAYTQSVDLEGCLRTVDQKGGVS